MVGVGLAGGLQKHSGVAEFAGRCAIGVDGGDSDTCEEPWKLDRRHAGVGPRVSVTLPSSRDVA